MEVKELLNRIKSHSKSKKEIITEEDREMELVFLFLIYKKKISFEEAKKFLERIIESYPDFNSSRLWRIIQRKKDSWNDCQNSVYYKEFFVCDRDRLKEFKRILGGVENGRK